MDRGGRLVTETCVNEPDRWALGRVHLGFLQPRPQLSGSGPIRVLFHGELSNEQELQATFSARGAASPDGAAAIVGALYRDRKHKLASALEGSFCAAVLDDTDGSLLLISDRLGSYPLYWFTTADRLVFASELRAALRDHPRPALNVA